MNQRFGDLAGTALRRRGIEAAGVDTLSPEARLQALLREAEAIVAAQAAAAQPLPKEDLRTALEQAKELQDFFNRLFGTPIQFQNSSHQKHFEKFASEVTVKTSDNDQVVLKENTEGHSYYVTADSIGHADNDDILSPKEVEQWFLAASVHPKMMAEGVTITEHNTLEERALIQVMFTEFLPQQMGITGPKILRPEKFPPAVLEAARQQAQAYIASLTPEAPQAKAVNPVHAQRDAVHAMVQEMIEKQELLDRLPDMVPELVEYELPESANRTETIEKIRARAADKIRKIVAARKSSETLAQHIEQSAPADVGVVRDAKGKPSFFTTAPVPKETSLAETFSVSGIGSATFLKEATASVNYGDKISPDLLPKNVGVVTNNNGQQTLYTTAPKAVMSQISDVATATPNKPFSIFSNDGKIKRGAPLKLTEAMRVTPDGASWLQAEALKSSVSAARLSGGLGIDELRDAFDISAEPETPASEALGVVGRAKELLTGTMARLFPRTTAPTTGQPA